jgi:hypothetical protein
MTLRKALIAGSTAAGALMLLAGGASAATIPVQAKPAIDTRIGIDGAAVDLVAHRPNHRVRHWDRRYHGPRYRYKRPGWGYYHGGYWYRSPWWTLPLVAPAIVAPTVVAPAPVYGGGGHVQYCLNKYRSYNPQTDQYLGYDGYYHYCVSPYR